MLCNGGLETKLCLCSEWLFIFKFCPQHCCRELLDINTGSRLTNKVRHTLSFFFFKYMRLFCIYFFTCFINGALWNYNQTLSSFSQNPWHAMAFHLCVRSVAQIWRTNRSRWRPRLPCWLKLHCSSVATSSDFTCGPPDTSQDPPSGSAEKPPHTPVMLKEVLHYLDIQPDEVCLCVSALLFVCWISEIRLINDALII